MGARLGGRGQGRPACIRAACSATGRPWPTPGERIPRGTEDASLPLPLHRHDHRLPLAGVLRPGPSDDAFREPRAGRWTCWSMSARSCGLVTGSETGHEAAVPYVHYFEGMLSLGPYRVPDAGRDMQRIWDEVPAQVAKFQTGPLLPAAAVGTGVPRLRGGPVVLGRLQQQAADAVGPPRPVQRPLRHAADVHVRPQAVAGAAGPLRRAATRPPRRWPGPPATRRCSPTAG